MPHRPDSTSPASSRGGAQAGASGWMIYGATGYTGRLVTAEAVRRGLRPVLGGRNATALRAVAAEHGLATAAFPLDDPAEVRRSLAGVRLAVRTAGPVYAAADAGERLQLVIQEDTPHRVNPESVVAGLAWFVKWLRP